MLAISFSSFHAIVRCVECRVRLVVDEWCIDNTDDNGSPLPRGPGIDWKSGSIYIFSSMVRWRLSMWVKRDLQRRDQHPPLKANDEGANSLQKAFYKRRKHPLRRTITIHMLAWVDHFIAWPQTLRISVCIESEICSCSNVLTILCLLNP